MKSRPKNASPLASSGAIRAELDRLGQQLAVRRSITFFAAGIICSMLVVMTFGLTVRLAVDSVRLPYLFWPIATLCCGSVCGGLYGFFKGRHLLLQERAQFRHYLELRAKAGLDQCSFP